MNPTWTREDRINVAVLNLGVAGIAVTSQDNGTFITVSVVDSEFDAYTNRNAISQAFSTHGLTAITT
ncbi:hypothetical protein K1W54_04380 [Micromonospora sp. CPCC 205371]|nr:hypothetical protein [Micromonospora sp. CPCC 205371]